MLGRYSVRIIGNLTMLLVCASLISLPSYGSDTDDINLNLRELDINLGLTPPDMLPPILDGYTSNDYMSLYGNNDDFSLRSHTPYPLGLIRFKADRSMRVRGWQIRDNIYFGQAKVGKNWGLGLVLDRGSHYYGLNNRGVSFLKKF